MEEEPGRLQSMGSQESDMTEQLIHTTWLQLPQPMEVAGSVHAQLLSRV